MFIPKRKIIVAVGFLSLLFGFGIFTNSRITSEHDLLICQVTTSRLLMAIKVYQMDYMGQLPSSLDQLKDYYGGKARYYDSHQKRSVNFRYYTKKGSPLILSSETIRQGWAGRPVRVLGVAGLGVVTVSDAEFASILSRMEI